MAIPWIKLLPLGLMGVCALGDGLDRAHRGWPLDFPDLPREPVAHRGHAISVCRVSLCVTTADSAWVGFERSRPWTFALGRQGWLRFEAAGRERSCWRVSGPAGTGCRSGTR